MVCKRKPDVGVARETEQHEARSAGAVPCVRLLEPPTSVQGGVQRRSRAESTLGFGAFRKLVKVELLSTQHIVESRESLHFYNCKVRQ